ncbi:MAG: head-tail connector protein [Alistipes sp.]|nr:head-tail connector protein [Alistipes sp.]
MSLLSLPETKNYLRVDHCEDDKLILTLMETAHRLVMDVGRMDEKRLAENEETSRQAMLYTVSYLYENRNTADFHKLTLTLRSLLFAQREGVI